MDIEKSLKEYGLSENEVKIYLTLIKAGESTVQIIAKNAGLPRTTVYHILDKLLDKSLVGFVIKDYTKYFQATKPQKMLEILEDKKKMINEIIPELSSISETMIKKPDVLILEGLNGIKGVLQDLLKEENEILHYGDIISLQKVLQYAFPQYITERVKRKIPIRIICKKEDPHEDLLKNSKKEYRKFVFIPNTFLFNASVFIFSKKVAILNLKKEPYYAIIIKNPDFYETQKNLFELLWDAYRIK